jgi:hypothetical protein
VHEVVTGHETDTSGAYADRSAVWSPLHAAPFHLVACPSELTATHQVVEAHDTELKSFVPSDLDVHELPFQVLRFSAEASAQNALVGQDSVPASESKTCRLEGALAVQVTPLKERTVPEAVAATQETVEVHVTPIARSVTGALSAQVAPL